MCTFILRKTYALIDFYILEQNGASYATNKQYLQYFQKYLQLTLTYRACEA